MPADGLNEQNETLRRLAVSLGCSTEAFSDPTATEEGQTLEFLRLWLTIEDGQDRAEVLALMRSMSVRAHASGEPVALAHAMQKPE